MDDLIAVGKVAKAHGRYGEVLVLPFSEDSSSILELNHVYLTGKTSKRVEVLGARIERRGILLLLEGIADRETAKEIVGNTLEVKKNDLPLLPEDTFFTFEVMGLNVETEAGEEVGKVEEILKIREQDVYLVRKEENEILIPAIDSVVKKIDLKSRKMIITSLEGFVEK